MITSQINPENLKKQPLNLIPDHQQTFDVEPMYPLRFFEEFVTSVDGDCNFEASCKIELDKLIGSRFLLFYKDKAQQWEKYLRQSLTFFRQVEN